MGVPRGGGLEGRHAHGELEAHGGGGEEYGSCVRENNGCRDSRAMVCKEGVGGVCCGSRDFPTRVNVNTTVATTRVRNFTLLLL